MTVKSKARRGWLLVVGLSLLVGMVFGLTLAGLSVYASAVSASLVDADADVSRAATAFMLAMTIMLPASGWLLDRYSARRVMGAGIALVILGCLLAARGDSIAAYAMAMALCGAGVGASTYVPATVLIARWIDARRGLAFAILMSGTGIGTAAMPMLIAAGIERLGWRATLSWSAALIATIAVPVLLLVRTPPRSAVAPVAAAPDATLHLALRSRLYWLFVLQQVLAMSSNMGLYFFIVPSLLAAGYPSHTAIGLYGATGIAGLAGFLVFGALADRYGAWLAQVLGFALCAASILPLLALDARMGLAAPLLFVVVWGATSGLSSQLAPLLLVDLQGVRHFGALMGFCGFVSGLAGAMAPLVTADLHRLTGAYAAGFALCAGSMALAAITTLPMRGRLSSAAVGEAV